MRWAARQGRAAQLELDATRYGFAVLRERPFALALDSVAEGAEENTLTFTGTGDLPAGVVPHLLLTHRGRRLEPVSSTWDEHSGAFEATFSFAHHDWEGRPLGTRDGGYALRARLCDSTGEIDFGRQFVEIRDADCRWLPWRSANDLNRFFITRTRVSRAVWVRVSGSPNGKARGRYAMEVSRQKAIAAAREDGLIDAVLFESYHGKQVSDSVRELFELIRQRWPQLPLYWSVASTAVPVPTGARGLVIGSQEWSDVLFRARWLINNSNFPAAFRKQPGQRYLQTWHGTPMKKIAEDMPAHALSAAYRLTMRREAKMWDTLLAQNDFSAEVLPKAFWFEGEVLNLGYPRNDLLAPGHPKVTDAHLAELRERLGIRPEERVVLYAPTWRDNRRVKGGYALSTQLDFSRLASLLPSNTRVLLRGHVNTVGSSLANLPDIVTDVSEYSEISELFLLTDVLVTDYSSMLFDFCVTQKPMLFFVPDLDEYENSTRGFYLRFSDICPGEMYSTTESLAAGITAALADPASLSTEAYAAFAREYAPRDDGRAGPRVLDALVERGWFE